MGIKIKNLQTGEFEKFNIPALKGEKGEPGEIEPSEKVDYIGKQHSKLRDTMNTNVDYIIKTAIGEFNYLDYEGQHITATNSIEGHAKSAILKGNTLVNLSQFHLLFDIQPSSVTTTDVSWYQQLSSQYVSNSMIKPNTKYIVKFGKNTPSRLSQIYISGMWSDGWKGHNSIIQTKDTITSTSNYQMSWSDGEKITQEEWSKVEIMIIEYQDGMENWDIPYFEGITSCKMPILHTIGKNLVGKLMYGSVSTGGNIADNMKQKRVRTDYINIQNEEKITIKTHSREVNQNISFFYDENKKFISQTSWNPSITNSNGLMILIPSNAKYVICEFTHNLPSDKDLALSDIKVQIEKGDIATIYEPYKTSILSLPEDLELRGIGDVQDTLDCLTGELTERIGEYQITGEENWDFSPGPRRLQIRNPKFIPNIKSGAFACDILEAKQDNHSSLHGTDGTYYIGYTSDNWLRIILDENLTSLEQGKEWLKANKPTIQYQLKTESIKTVDLSDNHVYSYKGTTHYDCSSAEGSLVPTLFVKVPTDTQLTIQEQKATTQTLLIKNMDLQQSIKEVQAMNLAFNTALYNSFNSIREEVEDIKKHISTNENLEGSF